MRRRARINQIVSDFARKPFADLRVLDLASLEGDFSIEFAMRGAKVVGIEGRSTNIERAQARHSHPNLTFVRDDVRNLSRDQHGEFDVVLCLGILYHLDAPDCFKLLERIAQVCTGFAVIDTHVSLTRSQTTEHGGHRYAGCWYEEYGVQPTPEETEQSTWASIGNLRSFWPTRPSLVNAIIDAGFTSVYETQYPAWGDIPADRVALVAVKGTRQGILAAQVDPAILSERVDEVPKVGPVARRAAVKAHVRRLARLIGLR
jgi:hypothetical protein